MRYYKYKNIKNYKYKIEEENNIIIKTNRAVHSLYEVECFLHGLDKVFKYMHLYKFLK